MSVIFSIPSELLMVGYIFSFLLGAIVGSFLNVYIYRFHTGKSLAGRSHCLSCGEVLRWFELFPLLSYIGIFGHCRHCKSKVPIRYFLVELLTATLFVLVLTVTTTVLKVLLLWLLSAVLVVILVYDFYHYIIPDSLTLTLSGLLTLLLGFAYFFQGVSAETIGYDLAAALLASLFFFMLWFVSKGQWLGFGDVKLVFPLAVLVGAYSVFSFVVMSFWIGAAVSVLLLLIQKLQRGKSHLRLLAAPITMKSAVPFAPFLIAGALVTFFANINVLTFFHFTL